MYNGGDTLYSYGEALTCLPSLDLLVQGEARYAAHRLGSLEFQSYLHCSGGHSIILMWIQKSDPIFNMGVEVMRSAYNFEPKYRVPMLARGEWTRGPRPSPVVSGLSGIQFGPEQ